MPVIGEEPASKRRNVNQETQCSSGIPTYICSLRGDANMRGSSVTTPGDVSVTLFGFISKSDRQQMRM